MSRSIELQDFSLRDTNRQNADQYDDEDDKQSVDQHAWESQPSKDGQYLTANGKGSVEVAESDDTTWINAAQHRQKANSGKVLDIISSGCRKFFHYRTNRMALIHSPCACFASFTIYFVILAAWTLWVYLDGVYMPIDVVTAPSVSINTQRLMFSNASAAEEDTINSGVWRATDNQYPRPRWCSGFQTFMIPGINTVPYSNQRTYLTAESVCLSPDVSKTLFLNFRKNPFDSFQQAVGPTRASGPGTDVVVPTALVSVPAHAVEATDLFRRFVGVPISQTYYSTDGTPILDQFSTANATLKSIAEQTCDVSFTDSTATSSAVATALSWFQSDRVTVYFLTGVTSFEVDLQMYLAPPRYAYPFHQLIGAATEVDLHIFNFLVGDWWALLPGPFTDLGNYNDNFFETGSSTTNLDPQPQYGGWIVDMPTVLVSASGTLVTGCNLDDPTASCVWSAGEHPTLSLTAMLDAAEIPSLNFNNAQFAGSAECPTVEGCAGGSTQNSKASINRYPYRLTGLHLLIVVDYETSCVDVFDTSGITSVLTDNFNTECQGQATPFITLRVREVPATSTTVYRSPQLSPSSAGYQQYNGIRISITAAGTLTETAPYFVFFQFCGLVFMLTVGRKCLDTIVWGLVISCPKRRKTYDESESSGGTKSTIRNRGGIVYCREWYQRVCCTTARGEADDDDVVAWGEVGYQYKPLELKEFNNRNLEAQQALEAQRQLRKDIRTFATLQTDPVFGSTQKSGFKRPFASKNINPRVADVLVAKCSVLTEDNEKNSVRELQRQIVAVTSGHESLITPVNSPRQQNRDGALSPQPFDSQNPNPRSLGGSGANPAEDPEIVEAFSAQSGSTHVAERRSQVISRELLRLYRSFAAQEHAAQSVSEFRAKLNQCVQEDFAGLQPQKTVPGSENAVDQTRAQLLEKGAALDAALGVLLRGQGNPFDNVLRLAVLEWWQAHAGHRIFAMHKHTQEQKDKAGESSRLMADGDVAVDVAGDVDDALGAVDLISLARDGAIAERKVDDASGLV